MSKILFYDLETTGVKHWRNGIHQISGLLEVDGKLVEEFNYKVKPHPKAEIEEEALQVGGVTQEQIMQYEEMYAVYGQLTGILARHCDKFNKMDKIHLCGYNNAGFDNPFFRAFFVQNGDKYFGSYFYPNPLDVYVLASFLLVEERTNLENFQLRTVARYLGIKVDEEKLHDALYDVSLTRDMYHIISERLNGKPIKSKKQK